MGSLNFRDCEALFMSSREALLKKSSFIRIFDSVLSAKELAPLIS